MIDEHQLIQDIQQAHLDVDGALTARDYNRIGDYTAQTAINKFGGWNKAKYIAGIEKPD